MEIIRKTLLCIGYVLLFSALPAWAGSAATPHHGSYDVRDGQVYYRPYGKPYEQSSFIPVKGADAETLSEFDKEMGYGLLFGDYVRDKNHVYHQGQILEGLHPDEVLFLEQDFDQIVLANGLDQLVSSEDLRTKTLEDWMAT